MQTLSISKNLSIEDILAVAKGEVKVCLSNESIDKMNRTRQYVNELVSRREIAYGVNTGVGALADIILAEDEAKEFQKRILLSHAIGYGDYADPEIVRATM
ncbi:MAG: aromatic amino acid lyase, partial [Candidatus Njordarchaeota archaeon]